MWLCYLASAALAWYTAVIVVSALGIWQLYWSFSRPLSPPSSSSLTPAEAPHITIVRPVKGVDPYLLECLTSTFELSYPAEKLSVSLCVSSALDPALPLLRKVVKDHPEVDGRVFIEEDEKNAGLEDGGRSNLGPNPKIRNMSRAYREAKGDIIWILDCNVWVHKYTAGLLVDLLCGLGPERRKYKFVHHLPLALDVSHLPASDASLATRPLAGKPPSHRRPAGGLLEELFMSTAHAKFYTAIATAAVAPCTNGKSTCFRGAHLDALTQPSPGIDHFSHNICEDHLISDLLWRRPVPAAVRAAAALEGVDPAHLPSTAKATRKQHWGNHALLLTPPCVQPVRDVSVMAYAARRARWLRVRKFTVPLATGVEPGTESLLATTFGAAGLAYFLPGILPGVSRSLLLGAVGAFWVGGVVAWACVDRWVWRMLQRRLRADTKDAPSFLRNAGDRELGRWLWAWARREVLAFPVWAWAIFGGTGVLWRGKKFWVGMDMKVHEIDEEKKHI